MTKPLTILGIAGSLRKASYNRAALRAATTLLPANSAMGDGEAGHSYGRLIPQTRDTT